MQTIAEKVIIKVREFSEQVKILVGNFAPRGRFCVELGIYDICFIQMSSLFYLCVTLTHNLIFILLHIQEREW